MLIWSDLCGPLVDRLTYPCFYSTKDEQPSKKQKSTGKKTKDEPTKKNSKENTKPKKKVRKRTRMQQRKNKSALKEIKQMHRKRKKGKPSQNGITH